MLKSYDAPFFLLPLQGSLHCLNENRIWKTGAIRLDVPGAPTPTGLTGKLCPCTMMPDRPSASPRGSARVADRTMGQRRFHRLSGPRGPGLREVSRGMHPSLAGGGRPERRPLGPLESLSGASSCSPAFLSSPLPDRPGGAQQLGKVLTPSCTQQFGLSVGSLGWLWGLPSFLGPNSRLGALGREVAGLLPT